MKAAHMHERSRSFLLPFRLEQITIFVATTRMSGKEAEAVKILRNKRKSSSVFYSAVRYKEVE